MFDKTILVRQERIQFRPGQRSLQPVSEWLSEKNLVSNPMGVPQNGWFRRGIAIKMHDF